MSSGPLLIDQSHRPVYSVTGADTADLLNRLLSQKVEDLPAGESTEALNLDAQGHILQDLFVTRSADGSTYYFDASPDQAPAFAEYLEAMKFWSDATIQENDLAVLTVLGPGSLSLPDGALTRRIPWHGSGRIDALLPRAELTGAVATLEEQGATLAGLMAFTAERVQRCVPELSLDLDGKSIPHEVQQWIVHPELAWKETPSMPAALRDRTLPGAVHLHKGCYRGQETVARVENLGRSPRALVLLQLDGSVPELPKTGDPISAAGGKRTLGRLGTVVTDCDYGPIALGLVKRSALTEDACQGTVLRSGDCALAVDRDSLPQNIGTQAGRDAVDKLRGRRPEA